jgi:hypothetical protein
MKLFQAPKFWLPFHFILLMTDFLPKSYASVTFMKVCSGCAVNPRSFGYFRLILSYFTAELQWFPHIAVT